MEKQFPENSWTRSGFKTRRTFLSFSDRFFVFYFQDEIFEKARAEILDQVVNLSLIPSRKWFLSKRKQNFSPSDKTKKNQC